MQIQRIVAVSVIQRQRNRVLEGSVSFTRPAFEEFTQVAVQVGTVAVHGITGVDIDGCAIKVLDRDDVRDHRCDGIGKACVHEVVMVLAKI